MGKVRNVSNTLRTGRIGENTWYIRGGEQIVRQRLNNSNYGEGARRTEAQQERRAKWGNLVNFFKVIADIERSAYEGKERGVTDYNMFMKMNANSTPIYLTRQQVEAGASVPAEFVLSKGSLPSIDLRQYQNEQEVWLPVIATDLANPTGFSIETDTWGKWSTSFIARNEGWEDGDAICFVFASYIKDSEGIPRASVLYRELVLDVNSTQLAFDLLDGGVIVWRPTINTFAFELERIGENFAYAAAVIHSRNNGSLKVSSQSLFIAPHMEDYEGTPSIAEYITPAQRVAAIASYGVDGSVVLDPGV